MKIKHLMGLFAHTLWGAPLRNDHHVNEITLNKSRANQFAARRQPRFIHTLLLFAGMACLPVSGFAAIVVFDSADTINGDAPNAWTSSGSSNPSIDSGDKKEGAASLVSTGSGTDRFRKQLNTAINTGVTAANGYLHFWLYVSDVSAINATGQIEITSSGGPDTNECHWEIGWSGSDLQVRGQSAIHHTLANGWNNLHLPIADARPANCNANLSAINYFRLYAFSEPSSVTTKVDYIRFSDEPTDSGGPIDPPANNDFDFTSGDADYDAAYDLAMSEMAQNIVDGKFIAGAGWPQVWTRDTSYAIMLGAGLVHPGVSKNTLETYAIESSNVGVAWLQDVCGHFGGWPYLSDAIVGAQGAWEVYAITGDATFLSWAYDITKNSLVRAENEVFESSSGLMQGVSSFMESNSGYPTKYKLNGPLVGSTKALSTNVLYYNGYKYAAKMGEELGANQSEIDALNSKASALRNAIRNDMWLSNKGYYSYFQDENNELVDRMEGLGESLVLLSPDFETDQARIDSIFTNTAATRSERGLPSLWPRWDIDEYGGIAEYYHNGRLWPFVQGFWAMAAARHGELDIFAEELKDLLWLSQRQNTFAEFYELDGTFPPVRERQLWSDTGFLSTIFHGLFGMQFEPDGINFSPVKPATPFANTITLNSVQYRDMTLDISVTGSGTNIAEFKLDGITQSPFVPSTLTGVHSVEIILDSTPPVQYVLTTAINGDGSVDPQSGTYNEDTPVVMTANPDLGWQFDHWEGDLSGSTNPDSVVMGADKQVTAVFVEAPLVQYVLTTGVFGNGSVDPQSGAYNAGTLVVMTANPGPGWQFDRWEGSLSGSANPGLVVMGTHKHVIAVFVETPPLVQYVLTTAATGNGSVDPQSGTYIVGTPVVMTANPDLGWQFDHWEGDLSGSTNPDSVVMGADKQVTAVFVESSLLAEVTENGTAFDSELSNPPGEEEDKLFDNTTSTKWLTFANTGYAGYDFNGGDTYTVTQYEVSSANDTPARDPKDWEFQGSNNATDWATLDTRSGVQFSTRFETQQFTLNNLDSYQMYRLNVTANDGGNELQMSEVQMFGNAGPTCGDNLKEGLEVCDGADLGLGSEMCETQGYDGGTLACLSNCAALDTSGCTNSGGEVTLFEDEFNSGLGQWNETGEGDWRTGSLHSSNGYPASGSGSKAAHSDRCKNQCTITIANPVDLSSYSRGSLKVLRFVDHALDSGEYLRLELYNGNGWDSPAALNWTSEAYDDNKWHSVEFDLSGYMSVSNFKVRAVTRSSRSNEDVQFDDLRIVVE